MRATTVKIWRQAASVLGRHEFFSSTASRSSPTKIPQPFANVPGPEPAKLAEYAVSDTMDTFRKLHQDYGDVVKIDTANGPMVLLFSTTLYDTMCQLEGQWPVREASQCQVDYAEKHRKGHGLIMGQGRAWRKIRSNVNKVLGHVGIYCQY